MFLDASAIIAILAAEEEADALLAKIEALKGDCYVSPTAVYEATVGLARLKTVARLGPNAPIPTDLFDQVDRIVSDFLVELKAVELSIDAHITRSAIKAARDFGRASGHPAKLNFGDCFAYACAATRQLPLLFKGNDFVHTNIEIA